MAKRTGRRRADREARMNAEPAINPAPPGQPGGSYKPLSDHQVDQIIHEAKRVLAEIGMGQIPDELAKLATARGGSMTGQGRLLLPIGLVDEIIAGAAHTFTLHGRDPAHDIEFGGSRVYFGTGGAAVRARDRETGDYRPSTMADLYDYARLCDKLVNVSWFSRPCVVTDAPNTRDLDINTIYAMLAGTTKAIGASFIHGDHVDEAVEMMDMVLGGPGRFAERPICKCHLTMVISPLRYGEEAVEVVRACIRHNMPINAIIAAQAGATAPATPAGALVQTTAEAMAALALVNLFKPGHGTIFSNWPFVVDLRSGSFTGGGGETALLNAAAAQIGRALDLPTGVASSMTDAKAIDTQWGSEKALTALAAGLAGANAVYESVGMAASLLGVSAEGFVIDDEMLSNVYRVVRGVEVDEDSLAFETIRQAVGGVGHFLGATHTLAAMQRDYFYPELADRFNPDSWQEMGRQQMLDKAKVKTERILSTHYPENIDPEVDAQIRSRFNILLPEARMRAG